MTTARMDVSPPFAVGLALSLILGAVAAADQIAFQEDFEGTTALSERGWSIEAKADQSLWQLEDGRLHCVLFKKPYDGGSIAHRIPPVKRGHLQFEARVARKGSWGMGLKLVFNGMLLSFDNKQKAHLDRYIAKKGWQEAARGEFDRWHRYRIAFDVERGEVSYYVDEMEHPTYRETGRTDLKLDRTLTLGNYGILSSSRSDVLVDNIRLVSLDPGADAKASGRRTLPIRSYACTPAPDSGDSNGRVLTDRTLSSGKDSAQAQWRAFSGVVEVVLELEQAAGIGGVRLSACASPANNIAKATLFVEQDGAWRKAGVLNNPHDQPGVEPYALELTGMGPSGKRAKIVLQRGIYDFPMFLSEVELLAASSSPAAAEPAAAAPREDESGAWELANDHVRFLVSKRTGRLLGGWYLTRKVRVIASGDDRYYVVTVNGHETCWETEDQVRQSRQDGEALELLCENPELAGFAIRKRYWVEGRELRKRIEFAYSGEESPRTFLIHASMLAFTDELWKGGFVLGRGGLSGLVPTEEIRFLEAAPARMQNKLLLLLNYGKGFGVAHHRTRLNGRYVLPWDGSDQRMHLPYLLPGGWRIGTLLQKVKRGVPTSTEVAYTFFEGTRLDFWREYRDRPEVEACYAGIGPRPDWMGKVKAIQFASYGEGPVPGGPLPGARELVETFEDGHLIYVLWPLGVPGDYAEDETYSVFGGLVRSAELRENVRQIQAVSPRLKVAFYVFDAGPPAHARVFERHPEWFISKDKHGKPIDRYKLSPPNFSHPGVTERWVDMYVEVMRKYGLDLVYMDGGGIASVIDWPNDRLSRAEDKMRFFELWRQSVRKLGPDRGMFFNERWTPFCDGGFIELPHGVVSGDWRKPADIFYGVKVLQRFDPTRWNSPIYWSKEHQPYYCNYLIGLGMKPGHAFDPQDVHYITAAYETRELQVAEGGLRPDWRRDRDTQVEAFSLTQGRSAVVSVINHNTEDGRVSLALDPLAMGLNDGAEGYLWLFRMKHPHQCRWVASERRQREVYEETGWGTALTMGGRFLGTFQVGGRLDRTIEAGTDECLRMLVATDCPAAVWSVEGRRTHLWLPETLDVSLAGEIDREARRVSVDSRSERSRAEILVYCPNEWEPGSVAVNGESANSRSVLLNGQRFLIVEIDRGDGRIEVLGRPAERSSLELVDVKPVGDIRPGGALTLAGKTRGFDDGPIALFVTARQSADGIVELAGRLEAHVEEGRLRTEALQVPALAWGGSYTLELAPVANPSNVTALEVTMPKGGQDRYPYKPGWVGVPPAFKQVRRVEKSVRGIQVLAAATGTSVSDKWRSPPSSSTKGAYATLDLETLTFDVGYHQDAHSRFGYGYCGIECEGLRQARLTLTSRFADRVVTHEIPHHAITPPYFVGIMVDYHTPAGYTHRAALSLGLCAKPDDLLYPTWGKASAPSRLVLLQDLVNGPPQATLAVDLSQYAPAEWDGQLWFSVGSMRLLPGGGVRLELAPSPDPFDPQEVTVGEDLASLYQRVAWCPRRAGPVTIDGHLREDEWKDAPKLGDFRVMGKALRAAPQTEVRILYDDGQLYLAYRCEESKKTALYREIAKKDAGPWADDSVELFLQPDGSGNYHQFVLSFTGKQYCAAGWDERCLGWEAATSVHLDRGFWCAEIAIPLAALNATARSGDDWRINFCRNRPLGGGGRAYSAWSGFFSDSFHNTAGFGRIRFR